MLFLALAIQCCLATKNTAEHRRCDYVATHPVNGAKYRYRKSVWVNNILFLSASNIDACAFDIAYYLYRVAAGMARITRTLIGLGAAESIYVTNSSLATKILGGAEV